MRSFFALSGALSSSEKEKVVSITEEFPELISFAQGLFEQKQKAFEEKDRATLQFLAKKEKEYLQGLFRKAGV